MARLKRIQAANLVLDNGESIHVERIGKGRYSEAWKNGKHVYLITSEKDSSKEMLARMGPNPHLPDTEKLGWMDNDTHRLYRQPLYRKLSAKQTPIAWSQFKVWKQAVEYGWKKAQTNAQRGDHDVLACDVNNAVVEWMESQVLDQNVVTEQFVEAVRDLVDNASMYDYAMEARKANCAAGVDSDFLILLDACFDYTEVVKASMERIKKHWGY